MHLLPQLRKLERRYHQELVVVGVHSAKFPSEHATQNVRKAVLRYQVDHPVVNDRDFRIWQEYAVRAWPTLMFIDPQGKVIGKLEGEVPYETLEQLVGEMVAQFDAMGLLDRTPLRFRPEQERPTDLSFPGKVLADAASDRLFIVDSNHDRILVAGLDGTIRRVIGSGQIGLRDGPPAEAQFNRPQGVALDGDLLYVADTENHAIRRVDLRDGTVATLAGTGEQAMGVPQGGPDRETALNSPWDLVLHEGILLIAMAGCHQLWSLDPRTGVAQPYAGSGHEGLRDGPLSQAWLAQPSGLTSDGTRLYVADSETSALRTADLTGAPRRVQTIVGQGLFEFGDVDGVGEAVRLQHPLGVCSHEGVLYVADSYNNKIKRADPQTRAVTTWLGQGEPGHRDGPGAAALFYEPGGLSIAAGKVYIADTNNHAIRVADLATGAVTTLELKGLAAL
ncbi:MAG: alkyl hydroperoxide reductase [Chloroflexi bacterium]|nr:alkyl hydroperoxide reductase [Chloroflexota bacterium]